MKQYLLLLCLAVACLKLHAQERPITIIDEQKANRLLLYAVNENEEDYDILVTIEGTGFRQSKAKPRLMRLPATSKMNIKSLVIERGKTPSYTYDIIANDSLSRRALKKPSIPIKIEAKHPIVLYTTDQCTSCDSIVKTLTNSKYLFTQKALNDLPKMKEYLEKTFKNTKTPLASITNPIFNFKGKIITDIDSYDKLLETIAQL